MPLPYTGCVTCKQRHLKCDGLLPTCTRCLKANRPCYGTKDIKDSGIFIHSENAYASGKRKRPRGPRAASPTISKLPSPTATDTGVLVDELADAAIAHYIETNLSPGFEVPSLLRTVEEDLLPIYRARKTDPIIHLALSVLSLVIYGRTQSQPVALTQACVRYQQLLQQTLSTLSSTPNPSEKDVETALFVTFCMSRYEDAVHVPGTRSEGRGFTSSNHHDGSLAFIRSIKDRHNGTTHGMPGIVKTTRRCMIKSALLRSKNLPEWVHDGALFGEEDVIELTYDRFSTRLVHLRSQLRLLRSGDGDLESIDTLIEESRTLGGEFGEWSSKFPVSSSHLTPSRALGTTKANANHSYTNINPDTKAHAAICLRLHATDILILSTYISLLNLTSTSEAITLSPTSAQARNRLHSSAMAFITALNVYIGTQTYTTDVKTPLSPECGTLRWLVWPLSMILLAEEVDSCDRLFFEKLMKEAGRISGFAVLEDVKNNLPRGGEGVGGELIV